LWRAANATISSRCNLEAGPPVTIKPPLGGCASGERALDLVGVGGIDRDGLYPEQRRHSLNDGKKVASRTLRGISKHRHSREAWRDLFEQFQPFHADTKFVRHEPGGVAARPR
jgi:hypothetical protein